MAFWYQVQKTGFVPGTEGKAEGVRIQVKKYFLFVVKYNIIKLKWGSYK
ncbi:hypothetical protein DER71_13015 [Halanaerobium sp. DL-01]|nr:hypothetical protein [Halanaerobium sp. DL-01]RCW80417.1 hypothetical protein DER71_13015 [Halanaerobium sp. DL-01]